MKRRHNFALRIIKSDGVKACKLCRHQDWVQWFAQALEGARLEMGLFSQNESWAFRLGLRNKC
jgi:hypothetical protein